nr:uncharacterized protein LOC123748382 [Procambarus clarkii]
MLGRCRMRRGVSLEVIVEEDDNAEVVLDPEPLLEDDDDEDDSENGRSAPASPDGSDGAGGGRGRPGGSPSAAEERRRKRERRRTIGGLSRVRSVSCEALTLLDTSDMDSCCSEWDDDDELSTPSSNYVTLNRPISRRRILESSQSHCDSEDSGIEYHSNEDDPVLEDHSSIEDRTDADQSSDDVHDQDTATESDDDTLDQHEQISEISSPGHVDTPEFADTKADTTTTSPDTKTDAGPTSPDTEAETRPTSPDTEADTRPISPNTEAVTRPTSPATEAIVWTNDDTNTDECADAITKEAANMSSEGDVDLPPSTKTTKQLFEDRVREGGKEPVETAAKYLQEYSANDVLENNKVVIVETTPPVSARRPSPAQEAVDSAEEELQLKRAAYTIRNKEVQLEELPRPHTVRSVKQLFEDLNTPVHHFRVWRDLGRFRDIKSNPSSKILRFDRSDSSELATSRCLRIGSSFTLPRSLSHHTSPLVSPASNPRSTKGDFQSSTFPKESSKQEKPLRKSVKQEPVSTQGCQPVALRKPTVRGFNVKKALMEDPRTFQGRATDPTNTSQQGTNANHKLNHKSTSHNYKSQLVKDKSHHLSEAATDRSDTESLASDISEDSGVSNDSNISSASSVSTSTYRALDAYASDPSFKWIDPTVMAKIRAVGTTVIFFGPRQRPRHHDAALHKPSRSTPSGLQASRSGLQASRSGLQASKNSPPESGVSGAGLCPNLCNPSTLTLGPVAAPRIVGVVRKRTTTTASTTTSSTTSSTTNTTATPATTDAAGDNPPCSDDSGNPSQWRHDKDTTVVYDFTRQHPPTAWV